MLRRAAILVLVMLSISAPAYAIDHKNLDAGRPTRLDDAYTIAAGEIELETGLGATVERRGSARGVFPIELLYGALPNLQLGLGTSFTSDPRSAEPGLDLDLTRGNRVRIIEACGSPVVQVLVIERMG